MFCKNCDCFDGFNCVSMASCPYADYVKVVRCKDCQHAYIDGDRVFCRNMETPWHNYDFDVFTKLNDFCSYGERKDV